MSWGGRFAGLFAGEWLGLVAAPMSTGGAGAGRSKRPAARRPIAVAPQAITHIDMGWAPIHIEAAPLSGRPPIIATLLLLEEGYDL
jgi:hypothetical protein